MSASEAAPVEPLAAQDFAFEYSGNPAGTPLVLVHGLDSAAATFDVVAAALRRRRPVLTYDQRGHGDTPHRGRRYDSRQMADDLEVLIDHLALKRADLLGHSMGARTAVAFAAAHPDRALSVIVADMEMCPRLSLDEDTRERMLSEAARREQLFSDPIYASRGGLLAALEPFYGRAGADSVISRRALALADGRYRLLYRPQVSVLYGTQANADDLLPAFASLAQRTLVLAADPAASAISTNGFEQMLEARPDGDLVVLEGSAHALHRSHPQEFVAAVESFLDGPEAV